MITDKFCINVYSDMNTWIDFVLVFDTSEQFMDARPIVQKAYDDWWELPDTQFEPIADWISRNLYENGIEFEIYFKDEEE